MSNKDKVHAAVDSLKEAVEAGGDYLLFINPLNSTTITMAGKMNVTSMLVCADHILQHCAKAANEADMQLESVLEAFLNMAGQAVANAYNPDIEVKVEHARIDDDGRVVPVEEEPPVCH